MILKEKNFTVIFLIINYAKLAKKHYYYYRTLGLKREDQSRNNCVK